MCMPGIPGPSMHFLELFYPIDFVMVVETPGEARDAKERGPSSSESVTITSVSCLVDDGKQQTWRSHVAI